MSDSRDTRVLGAATEAESVAATYQAKPGFEPSLAQRIQLWDVSFTNSRTTDLICGPYEVRLPKWLAFEGLLLGPSGSHIRAIHKECVLRDFVVMWAMSSDGPEQYPDRLIVGNSKTMDTSTLQGANRVLLNSLWDQVVGWADMVWRGLPVSLLEILRLPTRLALPRPDMSIGSTLDTMYLEAVGDMPGCVARAERLGEEMVRVQKAIRKAFKKAVMIQNIR
ncbi:hypothetical protein BGZ63DRAFT_428695 [Mariannaea sp. PMI_226]|nr:hypothetical protein BGZ63DRAFT_428695 [Mariannaea sp. PMI_226]